VYAARDADVHAADRPRAEDDHGVARLDAEQLLGVDRAGERLGRWRGTIMYSAKPPSYW